MQGVWELLRSRPIKSAHPIARRPEPRLDCGKLVDGCGCGCLTSPKTESPPGASAGNLDELIPSEANGQRRTTPALAAGP